MIPPIADPALTASKPAAANPAAANPRQQQRLHEASQQFEAMLLGRVLKCLERTTQVGKNPSLGGGSQYGSMLVEAMSDAISRAGSLGLAGQVERGMAIRSGGATR